MQKLYCYVDETGQDTQGNFFLVAVVIARDERDHLRSQLEEIERATGKGRRKWVLTRDKSRVEYMRRILSLTVLRSHLLYSVYRNAAGYLSLTVHATARAITDCAADDYRATVFVDGLPKSQTRWFGKALRELGIRTDKVRGVRREEADALMRLADALCGFVRAGLTGQGEMAELLAYATAEGYAKEL